MIPTFRIVSLRFCSGTVVTSFVSIGMLSLLFHWTNLPSLNVSVASLSRPSLVTDFETFSVPEADVDSTPFDTNPGGTYVMLLPALMSCGLTTPSSIVVSPFKMNSRRAPPARTETFEPSVRLEDSLRALLEIPSKLTKAALNCRSATCCTVRPIILAISSPM